MKEKLLATLLVLSMVTMMTGCFFTVKEMTVDPDKGFNHTTQEAKK